MKQLQLECLVAIVLLAFLSCKSQNAGIEIIIEGRVQYLPNGKVYLTDAYNWKMPLDSAECKNGHFIFKWKPRTKIIPFEASISFPDSTYPVSIQQLLYRNHMRKDSLQHASSAFFLGKGYTRIEGALTKHQFLRVFGSKETDRYYKIMMP